MARPSKRKVVSKDCPSGNCLGGFTKDDLYAFRRKSFQLTTGISVLILTYTYIMNVKVLMIIFALGVIISFLLRKFRVPLLSYCLEWFGTPAKNEIIPGKGFLILLLGFALPILLFPRDVALASIAIMSVGDSIAHIVGRFKGTKPKPISENKMIEGSIVGAFCAFMASMLFVPPVEAFFASVFAMMLVSLEVQIWHKSSVDDGIILPVAAGVVMVVIRYFA